MGTIEQLLKVADKYSAHTKTSLGTLGTYIVGQSNWFATLATVSDTGTRRADRAFQWFSDNWPDDLDWPKECRRPAPKKLAS
ncbi:MAG: hypothetical protein ACU0CO_10170 [Shimia sp.]